MNRPDLTDKEIAELAAGGDPACRQWVNEQVHAMICARSAKFCKLYCQTHRYRFKCTLPLNAWPAPAADAPWCDWGNGSYAWMLEDLTKPSRLRAYQGKGGASLKEYLNTIANSLAFRERWKNWRFSRAVGVPVCVQRLGDKAPAIFYGLYNQKCCEEIAQQTGLPCEEVKSLAEAILVTLTRENKLHLLTPPQEVSLTIGNADENEESEIPVPFYDMDAADREMKNKIAVAWRQLEPVEQFVLESMVIEQQDANAVLNTLKYMGLSVKKGVSAEQMNRQQLYHFRRKTLKKLALLLGLE